MIPFIDHIYEVLLFIRVVSAFRDGFRAPQLGGGAQRTSYTNILICRVVRRAAEFFDVAILIAILNSFAKSFAKKY